MKKIYSLMCGLLIGAAAFAQYPSAEVPYGTAEIDGFIEDGWAVCTPKAVDRNFKTELPTVTATWQAMWDDDAFYVVIDCKDDNHYPGWESGGNNWEYDKPEVYWDWNDVLIDGVGASVSGSGHYQLADGFLDGSYDVVIEKAPAPTNLNPGGIYAYSLSGEDYVYEMKVTWASFQDKDAVAITGVMAKAKTAVGFDVTVIDQDEGITTGRQRAVWSSFDVDECWNTMDYAGQIKLVGGGSANQLKKASLSVYPNPAVSNVTINADFNRVVISNILGQQVKDVAVKSKVLNVSDLTKGVYVVKAYKNSQLVGTAKVTKN